MSVPITRAHVTDIQQALADHHRYWGERDPRALHLLPLVHEFDCLGFAVRVEEEYNGPGQPRVVFTRALTA
ncbi:hypothetical protein [Streptomyces aurantiogriseus]|nr:hypothetical protein [Streptomyces aurantiogriseus]